MSEQQTRQALAEFIGTFMLVLVGAGAVILSNGDAVTAALAHGLILVAIVATYGHISGAHVNPAVSLAMWIAGRTSSQQTLMYMVAQFLGGIAAALVLLIVIPESNLNYNTLGQTTRAAGINELDVVLVEGILTFFLVSTVFQAAIYEKGGPATPVVIGFTLAACILIGGPLTGASLNPARTFGPWVGAIVGGGDEDTLSNLLVYLLAIFGGGALAAFMHMDTFKDPNADHVPESGLRKLRRSK